MVWHHRVARWKDRHDDEYFDIREYYWDDDTEMPLTGGGYTKDAIAAQGNSLKDLYEELLMMVEECRRCLKDKERILEDGE